MNNFILIFLAFVVVLTSNIAFSDESISFIQKANNSAKFVTSSVNQTIPSQNPVLSQIQLLRKNGKVSAAKKLALEYLKTHPNDLDVMVVLGYINYQEKDYTQAEVLFNKVLFDFPRYTDATEGLIRIKIAKKQYKKASNLLNQALKINPDNNQLKQLETFLLKAQQSNIQNLKKSKSISTKKKQSQHAAVINPHTSFSDIQLQKGRALFKDKKYRLATNIFLSILDYDPYDTAARIALADTYLAFNKDMTALAIIKNGLALEPTNTKLLIKKAHINFLLYQRDIAAAICKKIISYDNGQVKEAQKLLSEIKNINPPYTYGVNEIGISTDNAYVSDQHSIWDYSSLYYSRSLDIGRITGKINYASRFGKSAPQFEIDFSPRFNRNIYIDLMASYADELILFPKYALGGEAYVNFPDLFEISAGAKYANIDFTHFTTFTASLNRYIGDKYWLSLRPYYFVPKQGSTSVLLTGTARRYFGTTDHYVSLKLGTGESPDLADLQTVNFIIIKNTFVNLDYEFPILNHRFVVDLGTGYQRWQYPSDLTRNLYDLNVGIKYRF